MNHPQFEQALPPDVSIQSDTWITRYRNYPVFSRTWFKHRTIAFGVATFLLFSIICAITFIGREGAFNFIVFGLSIYFIAGIFLLLIGQLLSVWIKSKNYAPTKEAILISCAIVFGLFTGIGSGVGAHYALENVFPNEMKQVHERSDKLNQERKERKEKEVLQELKNTSTTRSSLLDNAFIKETITPIVTLFVNFLPMALIILYQGSAFDLFIFFRQRKRLVEALRLKELTQAQEARREAELRLSVLVAQVEPHFLFNTLAGVRSAILTDPLRATVIVDHLVDYLRSTIPNMRNDGTSNQGRLAQQLDAAKSYLGLMKARIPRLSFEVTSEIADAALPPLLLISLVENAIKHGIEPKIGPAHISVSTHIIEQDDEEYLVISVKDDGVGFGGTTSGGGIGLSNIRERLESTYGKHASLTLKAQPEGGVNACIILPLAV